MAASSLGRMTLRNYHKVTRTMVPPLLEPKESPYIVGPYLKPDYYKREYLTDPIQHRHDNDLDHFIYTAHEVDLEDRKVELLLLDDVEGLGVRGSIVEVPHRYGASRLIAMRRAEYATEFAKSWYKFGAKDIKSASSALSPRTTRFLRTRVFDLPVKNSAQIEPWHLAIALRLSGCLCPVEAIVKESIEEYIDDENNVQVKCTIVINSHERVEVKFKFV